MIRAANDPRFQTKTFGEMEPQKPKEDPTNPESQFEYLLGVRMTKGQKWAAVIGITLGIYGIAYYINKKY